MPAGGAQGLVAVQVVLVHQDPAGEVLPRQRAHRMALIEDGLLRLGDRVGQPRLVAEQPELPGALKPRLEPRLGESGNPRHLAFLSRAPLFDAVVAFAVTR